MEYSQREHTLSVLPTLVYGDPPRARIDDGKLIHLSGAVPIRDEAGERALIHRLRDELNLVFGRRVDFDGREAARFLARLGAWNGELGDAGQSGLFRKQRAGAAAGDSTATRFDLMLRGAGAGTGVTANSLGKADADAVLRAWQEGLGLVPLEGGGWAPLPHGWLEKHGQRVADLLAARARRRQGRHPRAARAGRAVRRARAAAAARARPARAAGRGFERSRRRRCRPISPRRCAPTSSRASTGSPSCASAGLGGILADDMGLGKTLQTLCALRAAAALVVCPDQRALQLGARSSRASARR